MYLVKDERYGVKYLVFTWEDPRKEGYRGEVVPDVTLDYDMEEVHSWPEGQQCPEVVVGRAPDRQNSYKVFKYTRDLQAAGYEQVLGTVIVLRSWRDLFRLLPDPERTDDEEWYQYLDRLDEATRRRRQRQAEERPAGTDREQVAAWVAKKHLVADSSIREVWYLPEGAPPQDIRLLEVNERLASGGDQVEAIDFGLDVDGAHFRLFVADLTSEELERIKDKPGLLPSGWSLRHARTWGRRG